MMLATRSDWPPVTAWCVSQCCDRDSSVKEIEADSEEAGQEVTSSNADVFSELHEEEQGEGEGEDEETGSSSGNHRQDSASSVRVKARRPPSRYSVPSLASVMADKHNPEKVRFTNFIHS